MILVNGKQDSLVPVSDRGLQYGDGVWETIAVVPEADNSYQERPEITGKIAGSEPVSENRGLAYHPQFIESHLDRLLHGCDVLAIRSLDLVSLRSEIKQICAQANSKSVLKIIITRGGSGRGYRLLSGTADKGLATRILALHPWGEHIETYRTEGILLQTCQTRLAYNPLLSGFKHLNRLEQVLASIELETDAQEGLMLDFNGHVIEGTMSNLFIINKQQEIQTPLLSGYGIEGIMRNRLKSWLQNTGFQVIEKYMVLDDVLNARSILMTNSIIGIWPVRMFNHRHYQIPVFCNTFNKMLTTE